MAANTVSPAAFADRHALAGEHRLVHAGGAVEHDTVDRQALARPHDEDVAGQQRIDRHVDQAPSRSMRAVFGCRRTSASIAAVVPALARFSSSLPISTSVMTAAEASK